MQSYEMACDLDVLRDEVYKELERAVEKHGWHQTPMNPLMDDKEKFIILVEEIGEVARAMTYDEGGAAQKKAELLQVIAMASAWYMSPDMV